MTATATPELAISEPAKEIAPEGKTTLNKNESEDDQANVAKTVGSIEMTATTETRGIERPRPLMLHWRLLKLP